MAIWQFTISLFPASCFPNTPLNGTVFLEDYFAGSEPEHKEETELRNYWLGEDPFLFSDELEDIFGNEKDNWGDGKIYQYSSQTYAEVWDDTLDVRFDMHDFDEELYEKVIEFAKSNALVIVFHADGKLWSPSLSILIQNMKESRAYRFAKK